MRDSWKAWGGINSRNVLDMHILAHVKRKEKKGVEETNQKIVKTHGHIKREEREKSKGGNKEKQISPPHKEKKPSICIV